MNETMSNTSISFSNRSFSFEELTDIFSSVVDDVVDVFFFDCRISGNTNTPVDTTSCKIKQVFFNNCFVENVRFYPLPTKLSFTSCSLDGCSFIPASKAFESIVILKDVNILSCILHPGISLYWERVRRDKTSVVAIDNIISSTSHCLGIVGTFGNSVMGRCLLYDISNDLVYSCDSISHIYSLQEFSFAVSQLQKDKKLKKPVYKQLLAIIDYFNLSKSLWEYYDINNEGMAKKVINALCDALGGCLEKYNRDKE